MFQRRRVAFEVVVEDRALATGEGIISDVRDLIIAVRGSLGSNDRVYSKVPAIQALYRSQ